MKLCINCKHYEKTTFGWCSAPQNGISPIDGGVVHEFAHMARNKAKGKGCSIDGDYFELRPLITKKKWWEV